MVALQAHWNPNYIILSYVFSFVGSYVGVCLSDQFRLCSIEGAAFLRKKQILWLLSFSIAGVAIWSMHFIGMGALSLSFPNEITNEVSIKFDTGLTVASFIAPILCLYFGLYIATNDRVFVRDSDEFGNLLLEDARNFSIKEAKNKSNLKRLALFKGLKPIVIGGLFTGAGVCVMHYIGMTAMEFEGTMSWDIGIIAASVIIAEVVSIIALWIVFRLLPLYPGSELLRVASAAVMGVAVCGMHYTGMYAATFYSGSEVHSTTSSIVIGSSTAVLSALFIGMVMMCICLIFTAADMRARSSRTSKTLRGVETLLNSLKNSTAPLPDEVNTLLIKYDKILASKYSVESGRRDSNVRPLSSMVLPSFYRPQRNSLRHSSNAEFDNIGKLQRQSSHGRYSQHDLQDNKSPNERPRAGSVAPAPQEKKVSEVIELI